MEIKAKYDSDQRNFNERYKTIVNKLAERGFKFEHNRYPIASGREHQFNTEVLDSVLTMIGRKKHTIMSLKPETVEIEKRDEFFKKAEDWNQKDVVAYLISVIDGTR